MKNGEVEPYLSTADDDDNNDNNDDNHRMKKWEVERTG